MPNSKEQKTTVGVRAGHRIRDSRADRAWSQRELSEKTDNKLSSTRIANYEQGIRKLGVQEAEILGKALHVQPAYLMGITALKTPLSPIEEELVKNYRTLPENERDANFRRIEALALAYKIPVGDERLAGNWTAPETDPELAHPTPIKPTKHSKRKTSKA